MPRRVLYPLVIAFVLAGACFMTSTWYVGQVAGHIGDNATAIASGAIPSIVELATTRQELRRLDLAATRFEHARGDRERAELVGARGDVDAAFERYLALPNRFAGEHVLSASVHHGLTQVDRAVSDLAAGTSSGTSAEVTHAVDDASNAIRDAIVFNADHAGELAATIDRDRGRAREIAWALDILSALLTAATAFIALRGLVAHQRVLDSNRRLLEHRAHELEQFAARVAHDVLSPLSVTRLAVESSLPDVTEPVHRRLERAQRGLARVVAVVDGLLHFARAGAKPEPGVMADVGDVARSVVDELEPLAREGSIALSFVSSSGFRVAAHEGVIASVVENLAGNALKYVGARAGARVDVRVRGSEHAVRIEVEDNGPGIPPDIRDTLWDPHVRGNDRTHPGIGLGLATVKRIVDAHGGHVGVESSLGAGSLFWCELPRATAAADLPIL